MQKDGRKIDVRQYGTDDSVAVVRFFKPLLVEKVLFQKLGSEVLWRRHTIRPSFGREIHQIPIRPNCVDMIPLQLGPPEMEDFIIDLSEHVQDRPLHVVVFTLTFVVSLVRRAVARYQVNLGPLPGPGPVIDLLCGCFGNATESGVMRYLERRSIESIHQ